MLRQPAFPAREVERVRAEKLTSLAIRDQDTGAVAGLEFDQLVYAGSPVRLPSEGMPETVGRLKAGDVAAFHRRTFGPRGMVVAVVGAIRAKAAVEAVEAALGGWTHPVPAP